MILVRRKVQSEKDRPGIIPQAIVNMAQPDTGRPDESTPASLWRLVQSMYAPMSAVKRTPLCLKGILGPSTNSAESPCCDIYMIGVHLLQTRKEDSVHKPSIISALGYVPAQPRYKIQRDADR